LFVFEMSPKNPKVSVIGLLGQIVFLVFFAAPVALAALGTLGLPLVLWLRHRRWLNAVSVCAGATVIGAIVFAALAWGMTWDHPLPSLEKFVTGAEIGLASGVAFSIGAGITIRPSGRAKTRAA
jgi:hypothetical protein